MILLLSFCQRKSSELFSLITVLLVCFVFSCSGMRTHVCFKVYMSLSGAIINSISPYSEFCQRIHSMPVLSRAV